MLVSGGRLDFLFLFHVLSVYTFTLLSFICYLQRLQYRTLDFVGWVFGFSLSFASASVCLYLSVHTKGGGSMEVGIGLNLSFSFIVINRPFRIFSLIYISLLHIQYFNVFFHREPFWDLTDLRTLRNTLRKDPEFHHSDWRQVSEEAKDFIRCRIWLFDDSLLLSLYLCRLP